MNLVEITVRMKDEATSQLKGFEKTAKDSGQAAGKNFSDGFSKQMGGGLLGGLFGKGGGSVVNDAQRQGQNVGMGLGRGILQKFNQTLGSGLLSGLFGTSGGGKLFGNAGNTVVQDATKQGENIAQGFAKGLNNGFGSVKNQMSGIMGGLFGGAGGGADEAAGEQSGNDFGKGFSRGIADAFSKMKLPSVGGGGAGASGAGKSLLAGMLPGILGLSGKSATILGLGGSLLGALPAIGAIGGATGIAGLGAGVVALGAKQLIGTKNVQGQPATQGPLYNQAQGALTALQGTFSGAASALEGPLKAVFSDLPGMLKGIEPALKSVFSGAATLVGPLVDSLNDLAHMILPGLGSAFRAVAPLINPLVDGFGRLIGGMLPGLTSMLKSAAPAIGALSDVLGSLGHDLGSMFSTFAPVLGQSAVIFKALMDVLSALFPIIGKLAAEFASALGPVFSSVAGIVKSLLPVLSVLGQVIASFAAAVLGDLGSVFGAVATLIKDLGPSLTVLAKAFSQVFSVLENSGVFAVLGDALENLAPVIAKLINTLVTGLAPVFPALIQAVSQLASILITLLTAGLTTLLQAAIPVVAILAKITTAVILWLQQNHLLLPILAAIAIAIDPIGAAVIGLIAAIGLLATNWNKIWNSLPGPVKDVLKVIGDLWKSEWDALTGVAKAEWDAIAGVFKAVWAVIEGLFKAFIDVLTGNWTAAGNAMKTAGEQAWNAVKSALTGIWNALSGAAQGAWNAMKSAASSAWNSMKSTAVSVWDSIKSTLDSVWSGMRSAASSVWGGIESDASRLWSALKTGFTSVVSAIGTAWDRLEGVFKAPVNFLINTVYMGGIRRLWDDVMGAIGLGSLDLPSVSGLATGGRIPGFGGGDSVLAMLEPGEAVIDKDRTRRLAPFLGAIGVPGFASGGIVGDAIDVAKMVTAASTGNQTAFANALINFFPHAGGAGQLASMMATLPISMVKHIVSGLWGKITGAASASSSGGGPGSPGPGGGAPAANAALARKLYPAWGSGAEWTAWNNIAMAESGWSNTITNGGRPYNPYTVAYGIPQALPAIKMGAAANPPESNPTAQINWMVGYIKSVYGDAIKAWQFHLANGYYANGGATSSGWAVVGERGRELVKMPGGATVYPAGASAQMAGGAGPAALVQLEISSGGQSAFEQFMLKSIREWVRVKGGGDVQKAFGRS